MNHITKQEFGKIIRKIAKDEGIKKSVFVSGRISGWGNSNSGIQYNYPRFDWSYVRDYRRVKSYATEQFEEMAVSYSFGSLNYERAEAEKQSERFAEVFKKYVPADVYEERNGKFYIRVTNPFYGK